MLRKTLRIALSLLATIVLLHTIGSGPVSLVETSSAVDRLYEPYDTIRTDLSAYIWPLKTKHATTSVFADFRATHFHAGVDISTRGREGYKVYAMQEGYVSRIRVSSSGYGKSIEVTHPDGFTTLYAHLQRFAPSIESAVQALQKKKDRYQVTLRPPRNRFPVEQGDHIAYTGSSGAGGPHLHFEIRDQNGNPLNPLLAETLAPRARDEEHPVIEEVGFLPIKASTFIQGNTQPFYLRPIRKGSSTYGLNTIVHVTGTIGLTVKVKDGVGPRKYRNRGVALTFELDSTVLFSSEITRIPARETKQVALHYDWAARGNGKSHHQKLFIDEGNRLPFYNRLKPGSGILQSDQQLRGYHTYRITARDIYGNESALTGTLVFNHPPEIRITPSDDAILLTTTDPTVRRIVLEASDPGGKISGRWTYDLSALQRVSDTSWTVPYPEGGHKAVNVLAENEFGTRSAGHWVPSDARATSNTSLTVLTSFYRDYAYVEVSSSLPVTGRPDIKVFSGSMEADLHVRALTSRSFFASFPLDLFGEHPIVVRSRADINNTEGVEGFDAFTIHPITRGNGGVILSDDGAFRMVFPPNSVFSDMYVRLEQNGDAYDVRPWDALLDKAARVEMTVPDDLSQRRVGLFSERGSTLGLLDWTPPGKKRSLRGRVSRFLSSYVLRTDETGPVIGRISLRYRNDWLSGSFTIRDDRAGVDPTSLRVRIDDTPVIAAYETEQDRARLGEVIRLEKGRHTISVSVADHMGNRSTRTVPFRTR